MELRFLERNTPFTIEVLNEDYTLYLSEPFKGKFYDADSNISLTFICDELFDRFEEFRKFTFKISFAAKGAHTYYFNGKMVGTSANMFGAQLIELNVTSLVNQISIRRTPRIDIPLSVNLYINSPESSSEGTEHMHTKFLCEGISSDISSEGMGLLTDFEIKPEHGDSFMAEIYFKTSKKTQVAADLKRRNQSSTTAAFKNMYGFMFNFSGNLAGKNDLTITIIQYLTDSK